MTAGDHLSGFFPREVLTDEIAAASSRSTCPTWPGTSRRRIAGDDSRSLERTHVSDLPKYAGHPSAAQVGRLGLQADAQPLQVTGDALSHLDAHDRGGPAEESAGRPAGVNGHERALGGVV